MDSDFTLIPEDLQCYAEAHTTPAEPLLERLERDTHVNVLDPRMLSGAYQGKLLEMISRMIAPSRILEVGTYTGYSAICLAKGLKEGGSLLSIEHNPELEDRIRAYWSEAGLQDKAELRLGEALDILPTLPPASFDLIFLDADKRNYTLYYPLLKRLLKAGGWLLADNVLWSGKVIDVRCHDKDTQAMGAFNDRVHRDPDTENILLPLRDGISLVRKVR